MALHAMIMAGGGGTRFWPRSRAARPKQFLSFHGDRTLLQETLDRIAGLVPPERTWVITGGAHRNEAIRQLPELPPNQIVGEPMGRDTAACIGLGAELIAQHDPNAVMMVMPADHAIEPVREFARAVQAAEMLADEHPQALLTFGIEPTFPSTGYGYIHQGASAGERMGIPVFRVNQFREKPKPDVAEQYVASRKYFWNSGIFVWKVGTILGLLQTHKPAIRSVVQRIGTAWNSPQQEEVFRQEYQGVEKISIDFAVLEHAPEVLVLKAPYQWDDVGSWLALERRNPQDANGNTIQAEHHFGIKTTRCVIVANPGTIVTTIGVDGLVIIQDGDALLIADRKEEEKVKDIVTTLKATPAWEKYL